MCCCYVLYYNYLYPVSPEPHNYEVHPPGSSDKSDAPSSLSPPYKTAVSPTVSEAF